MHFLALAEQEDAKQIKEAMDYWYLNKSRNYETLQQNFPVPSDVLERQRGKLKIMSDWCMDADIAYTPTVFINGKRLPETFYLSDLKDIFA